MSDIDGKFVETHSELLAYLAETRASGRPAPASDLGYCLCGTVWNIEAMADQSFPRGTCPDCGEDAAAIEWAAPEASQEAVEPDVSEKAPL